MPAASSAVRVKGLRELDRAFAHLSRDTQKAVRAELAAVGEPVREVAEHLAVTNITNIGDRWSRMRLGVTSKLVYVAPRARSRRRTKRPNLAVLLLKDAMIPAVERSEPAVVAGLELVLDRLSVREGF